MGLDVLDMYICEMVLDVMYGLELNSGTLHNVTLHFVSCPQMDCDGQMFPLPVQSGA